MGEWERKWVRKMGLEDIPWDPERCCEHCIAERAARGEAVEEVAPPSGSRPKLLRGIPPGAGGSKGWSKRGGKQTLLKLARSKRKDS
ncbi:hypothetical protein BE21_56805 [Sorangium cellulosum]|uniref:Uncharacterized protein n=1 Tax=Sorangium cellulosum TaxID=56 RepID=A0A150T8Q7_SORCE|nr:hypothetical protein BE21_56805 [Sorangium cellulosum]